MTKSTVNAAEALRTKVTKNIYGEMPVRPVHLSYKTDLCDPTFAAGKATMKRQRLMLDLGECEAELCFTSVIPNGEASCPAIVNLGFEAALPNKFLPAEEIVERGYAIFHLSISQVSENDGNFKSGISYHISRHRRRKDAPGKATVWAWAMMRVIDHIFDLDSIDKKNIIVSGHGVGAISALICGGFDSRVGYVIANDPYAALGEQGNNSIAGEKVHLFCPAYADKPQSDPIAPIVKVCCGKKILLGSSLDRPFADPQREYDMLMDISERCYHGMGLTGLAKGREKIASPKDFAGDEIYYHVRSGTEYFSRRDWNGYLDFIDTKIGKKA